MNVGVSRPALVLARTDDSRDLGNGCTSEEHLRAPGKARGRCLNFEGILDEDMLARAVLGEAMKTRGSGKLKDSLNERG